MWAGKTSSRFQFVHKTDRPISAATQFSVTADLFVVYVGVRKTDDYRRNIVDTSADSVGFVNRSYVDEPNIHDIFCWPYRYLR
jgi:hypothetical protein